MTKKPVLIFSIADENNLKYEQSMRNSLKKFHPDIDYYLVGGDELKGYLRDDPMFFYRATPILGERFLKQYDLVVKLDADNIILGDLSYVFNTKDYDIGTVINWNRVDPKQYGYVAGWGIEPPEYFNCGFVAMRSEKFVHHWKSLCFTDQFNRLQYKEQDLLNILCYYGNYNVRCFDHGDGVAKYYAWHGLIGKGEWHRAILRDDTIIVPKGEGDTPFPDRDMEIKAAHLAGGAGAKKDNWGAYFSPEVMERINKLIT